MFWKTYLERMQQYQIVPKTLETGHSSPGYSEPTSTAIKYCSSQMHNKMDIQPKQRRQC